MKKVEEGGLECLGWIVRKFWQGKFSGDLGVCLSLRNEDGAVEREILRQYNDVLGDLESRIVSTESVRQFKIEHREEKRMLCSRLFGIIV